MTASISFYDEEAPAGAVGICPQCGGEGGMEMGERIFSCRFCRTNLYISTRGPLVYKLPLGEEHKGKEVIYLPFWRLRGLRYKVVAGSGEVEANLLDVTAPAHSLMPRKANLGIRPQAWKLILCNWIPGAPVADLPASSAVDETQIDRLTGSGAEYLLTRLVGEIVYLVLAPFTTSESGDKALLEGAFPDGPKYWIPLETSRALWEAGREGELPEPIKFIPLICPNCASPIPAGSKAEILLCPQCLTSWWPHGETLSKMPSAFMGEHQKGERLFPFWQIEFSSRALSLETRADLVKIALPYKIPDEELKGEHCFAVIPGFKLPPKIFLRMARMATLFFAGEHAPPRPEKGPAEAEPVRLPLKEAAEAISVVLASIIMDKRNKLPLVAEAEIKIERARLLYIPFVLEGREWKHCPSGQVIPENVMVNGANL